MIPLESIRVSRTVHPQGEADIATIEWCFTSSSKNPVIFHRAVSWVLDHNAHWRSGQVFFTFRESLEDIFGFDARQRGVEIHVTRDRWTASTWLYPSLSDDPPWLLRHPPIALPVYEDDALLCCHSSKHQGCEAWESHSCMPTLSAL